MFTNKYILKKATETLDTISTVDIDSSRPSFYWSSVRKRLQNLNKADTCDYSLAKSLGFAVSGYIFCFALLYVTCTKTTLCLT